ncbi:glycosyltransferase family 4 protein [Sphingomonas solaris]|uniref:Glycosyltransferase family 4 protein n=1 Tax=Alterirhizorhabdus solaris TaxID=2529389 RepID=A0A558R526_9SPHN|nr:glycosyltransferase family 4 protein [Sphingomonas solaris]TVV74457.1 glycosyltransferase family 4 protein [Sphingomonas solaris]
MRIAYVINSVEGGGAASPVPAVVELLRAHGANVRLFALTRRDGRAVPAMHAIGLTTIIRDGGESDHLAALRWLDRQIAAWKPDLIWTSLTRATLLGQLVGRRRGVPVASWQHAAFLKPANRRLLRATQKSSALWIADSSCVADLTAARLAVPPARLATWPLFAADPAAPRARPWQAGEVIRIGSLGRLHPVKGYDVLVGALARLRAEGFTAAAGFQIEIGGDGAERDRLAAMAAAADITALRLTGFTARPRDFLAGLHLYVQPSRSEGLCIAAHEAMQAGLPVIASAVGEMPRTIVEGVTGRSVPPADPQALAAALRDLLLRPGRLAAIGAASRVRVLERFGPAAFASAGAAVVARLPVSRREAGGAGRSASRVPFDRPA